VRRVLVKVGLAFLALTAVGAIATWFYARGPAAAGPIPGATNLGYMGSGTIVSFLVGVIALIASLFAGMALWLRIVLSTVVVLAELVLLVWALTKVGLSVSVEVPPDAHCPRCTISN
jgi:hypothetical protein